MSDVIFKYELSAGFGSHVIEMPRGAQILTFGIQNGTPVLWAKHVTGGEKVRRLLILIPTGQEFELTGPSAKDVKYIGSVSFVETVRVPAGIINPNTKNGQSVAQSIIVIHAFDGGEEEIKPELEAA